MKNNKLMEQITNITEWGNNWHGDVIYLFWDAVEDAVQDQVAVEQRPLTLYVLKHLQLWRVVVQAVRVLWRNHQRFTHFLDTILVLIVSSTLQHSTCWPVWIYCVYNVKFNFFNLNEI